MYVNKDYATNITVRETENTPDYELLCVSIRPHYLPREFTQVTVIPRTQRQRSGRTNLRLL